MNAIGAGQVSTGTFTLVGVPDKVTGLTATADVANSQVALAWTTPDDNGSDITKHQYRHRTRTGGTYSAWTGIPMSAAGQANVASYTVTGLTEPKEYRFNVRAVNDEGEGTLSADASAATKPGRVTGLTAEAGGPTAIDLSWTALTDDGGDTILDHKIEVCAVDCTDDANWSRLDDANRLLPATTYSHTGLTSGTTRSYRVSATNPVGTGPASDAATATTWTSPNEPTGLKAEAGDESATLSWTAPSSGGTPTKYQYQQKAGSGSYGSWENIALTDLETDGDTRSYTVTGLTNTVAYRFKVRGVAGTLEGTESSESSAVTPMEGICRRTAQVRDKLVDLIPMVDNCAVVTATHLAAITGNSDGDLILSNLGITAVKAGDFAGLGGVRGYVILDSNSSLASLPSGVFEGLSGAVRLSIQYTALTSLTAGMLDGLDSVTALFLDNNRLTSLGPGVFVGLGDTLAGLSLTSNQLRELPDGVFEGLTGLTSLMLQNNPGAPFALTLVPERVGDTNNVKVKVAEGAPFPMSATLTVSGGTVDGGTTVTVAVPAGATESNAIAVTPTGNVDTTVTLSAPSPVPDTMAVSRSGDFQGMATAVGDPLVLPAAATAPGAPRTPAAAPGDGEVVLTWTAPASTGGEAITRYEYRHKATGSLPFVSSDSWTSAGTALTATVSGLANGTPYSFEVRAVNSVGAGSAATESATPMEGICRRTAQVRDKLLDLIPMVDNCAVVTIAHLNAITGNNLGDLDLSSLGITDLKAGDFAGLSGVGGLLLNDNSLTSLPAGVFNGLTGVTYLTIKDNQLDSLRSGAFSGLDSLRSLNIADNRLSVLLSGVFNGVGDTLSDLTLTRNPLGSLPADVFDGFDNLDGLYLNDNQLRELPDAVFEGLTGLASLLLQGNPGADFALTLVPERVGDTNNVKVKVAEGAPFPMSATLTVSGGTVDGGTSVTVTVPAGATESDAVAVTPTGNAGTRVTLSGPSAVPATTAVSIYGDFRGMATAVGNPLVLVAPPAATAPGAPRTFAAAPGDGEVVLTWTAPASTGGSVILRYEHRRKATGSLPFVGSDSWTSAGTALTATVSGLTNDTPYSFEVRAVNTVGEGTAATASATPTAAARPTVSVKDATKDVPENVGRVVVCAVLDAPSGRETKVVVATADGTATAGMDYTGGSTELVFEAGLTDTCVEIFVTDDTDTEDAETFTVTLSLPADPLLTLGTDRVTTVTIRESDQPAAMPVVTLVLTPSTISENGGISRVTATISPALPSSVWVQVSAAAMSPATAGDFRLGGQPLLEIPANATESSRSAPITARDNLVVAPDKTVTVSGTIFQRTDVTAPADVTLTITDNEAPCTASASASADAVWSSCVRVGQSGSGELVGYGYSKDIRGGLDDTGFSHGGTARTVKAIDNLRTSRPSNTLHFEVDPGFGRNVANLVLHVGAGKSFDLADAGFGSSGTRHSYTWYNTGLAWSAGDTVAVWLAPRGAAPAPVVNNVATGAPTILLGGAAIGTRAPEAEQSLTASLDGVVDADGMSKALNGDAGYAPAWQWIIDGTESDAPTDTGEIYVPRRGNVGSRVKVRVRFKDDAGNEETLTSAATAAVIDPTAPPATGAPGAPRTLAAAPGDGEVVLTWAAPATGATPSRYEHRHKATGSLPFVASDSWTSAGTALTATVSGLTNGTPYSFEVRAVNSVGAGTAATGSATPTAAAPTTMQPPAAGDCAPSVANAVWTACLTVDRRIEHGSDYAQVGYDAVPELGGLSDTGFEHGGSDYTVERLLWDNGKLKFHLSADLADVAGLTLHVGGAALALDLETVAKGDGVYVWSRSQIDTKDGDETVPHTHKLGLTDGAAVPVVLAPTGTVADNHAAEGRPKIVAAAGGTAETVARVGTRLKVDYSEIKDRDGTTNARWSHQWIAGRKGIDSGTGKIDPYRAIPGANSADATYTPTTDDLGKLLKVRVSFTDGAGHVEHRISWAVGPVVAGSAQQSGSQGAGGNPIAGFTLFDNAAGGADVMALTDGAALAALSSGRLNIRAEAAAGAEIGSVRMALSGAVTSARTEGIAPYALFGDRGGRAFPAGTYTVTATPYPERGLSGTPGPATSVTFTVAGAAAAPSVTVTSTAQAPVSGEFAVTVRFSEPVTGFRMSELVIANGRATRSASLTDRQGYATEHEVYVAPDTGASGEITITVPAGVATDADGNPNTASAAFAIAIASVWDPLTGFTLFDNAAGGADVQALSDGTVLRGLVSGRLNVRADTRSGASIGSVRMALSGAASSSRTENYAPWALFGDRGGRAFAPGSYTVTATPYPERGLSGTAGKTRSVTFRVVLPALSVADAGAEEGTDETIDFAVTLDAASRGRVTVDYATSDGTAKAGADYTAKSGTLTFEAGETAKTVSVPVLDDSHDEDSETLTLTLSNPSGATIADGTATGTITNTDKMPQAWIARFGRTVAEQVVDSVQARLTAPRTPGVEATLAGQRIGGSGAGSMAPRDDAGLGAAGDTEARARLEALSVWLRNDADGDRARRLGSRTVSDRELLTGTSFALTGEAGAAGGGSAALWGRGAVSRFDGRDGKLSLDGEVGSLMLGADWTGGSGSGAGAWTAGLMLSHARGEGGYRGAGEGKVESDLTGLYPYGRYAPSERVTLWGVAGYGAGSLTLTPKGQSPIETDMDLAMGAVGLRGVVVQASAEGGPELAVKSDALVVRTTSEKTVGLAAAEADVTRLRLGLEGTWRGLKLGSGELTPSLEAGVRHDGGDAETGFGVDLGGGLAWSDPASGIAAEIRGRGLLTHAAGGFRERGLAGSLTWDPRPDSDRGLKLTLQQTVGASATGGMDALLGRGTLAGLAANDDGDELLRRRLEVRLGYGLSAFGDRFTSTPELGLGLSDADRDYSLGWRLGLARGGGTSLDLKLEATRRESANDNAAEHGIGFKLTARW